MFAGLTRWLGGYAASRRDLRLLYAAVFLSFLGASVTFPLRMLYAQQHHASPAELGLMAGSFLLAPLLSQLPMGWLVDRWGRVPVFLLGLISHPIISLLYIWLTSPHEQIALRFLEGISISAFQPATNAYIADVTPEEHRAEAYGASAATLSAGLLIGPLIGGLIGQYFGFVAAFIVNVGIEVLAIPLVVGHVHEPVVHAVQGVARKAGSLRDLMSIPLVAAYTAFFGVQVVMGTLISLWTIWLRDLGGSYAFIGISFTVFALPQIIFGTMAGRVGDRWGRAPVLLISGIVAAMCYIAYGFLTSLTVILALGVVEGIAIVFQMPVAQGFLADASPPEARGRAQGMAGAIGAVGGAGSAFISLPLYHQSRALPFILIGVVMIAASTVAAGGAAIFVRRRREQALIDHAEASTA